MFRVAQLAGIEYYLPATIITNDDLAMQHPDWTATKIRQKTGIMARHVAAPEETAADLAVEAARRLFAAGKVAPEEIDFVILVTQSPDYVLPTTACLLQDRLRIPKRAGAFDINQGCSGYVYGLAVANSLIEAGLADTVLLLTAETYSKFIHPSDTALSTIFGDGAAASVIRATSIPSDSSRLLGPFVFGTDGSGARHLIVKAGGARMPIAECQSCETADAPPHEAYLFMDGPAIFSFTLSVIPVLLKELYSRSGLKPSDIDLFVFHQANGFILEALRKTLGIPQERFVVEFENMGNTVSSSIPMALRECVGKRSPPAGAKAMLIGFGVGLSWAGAIVTLRGSL